MTSQSGETRDIPDDEGDFVECWQCGGIGDVANCFEDTCCGLNCDPEDPVYCCNPSLCDVCLGKGGYFIATRLEKTDGK